MGQFVTRGLVDKMTRQEAEQAASRELDQKINAGRPGAGDFQAAQAKWAAGPGRSAAEREIEERIEAGRPSAAEFAEAESQWSAPRRGGRPGPSILERAAARAAQRDGGDSKPAPKRTRAAKATTTLRRSGAVKATKAAKPTRTIKATKTTKTVKATKTTAIKASRATKTAATKAAKRPSRKRA